MSLDAALNKLRWNADHDELVELTRDQQRHLLKRIDQLETLAGRSLSIRIRDIAEEVADLQAQVIELRRKA